MKHVYRMKKPLILNILFLFLTLSACAPASKISMRQRRVFYAGGENGVKAALLYVGYTLVDDYSDAEVFVLNGEIPDARAIAARLQGGAGLVLIVGEKMSFRDVEVLFDYPVGSLIRTQIPGRLIVDEYFAVDDPLVTEIDWDSAPQVPDRFFIMTPAPGKPLIRIEGYVEVFLGQIGQEAERKFAIDGVFDEQHNLEFQQWKYFNYLIYHLVERAAGAEPLPFADFQ
jgi:hypothetical protein